MKAGYQSLVDVINYRHTQGPAWLQNTIPKKPLLARSTSVLAKPNHMRAGFYNNNNGGKNKTQLFVP